MSEEEIFDVVNEDNELTGEVKPKSEVHAAGLWHRAVHVWVVNSKKQILVQKRAKTKKSRPSLWDVTVGGHIGAGEDIPTSAAREMDEELGLKINLQDLQFLFIMKEPNEADPNGYIENVFQHVYVLKADIDPEDCKLLDYEVEAVKYITAEELELSVKKTPEQWMPHWEEYQKIIDYVKSLRK
jgi:isopentenyl-diphosphate Delta-isomerase